MKTLQNLNAGKLSDAPAMNHAGKSAKNSQSVKGFQRKITHSKDLLTFQSSIGGNVQISISELWALAESHDPLLRFPEPEIPVATPPAI